MARLFSHSIHKRQTIDAAALDQIAGEALGFLAAEPERLRRFLDITGLSPSTLRAAAANPHFAASLIDYIAADERCLVAFAGETGRDPADVIALQQSLAAPPSTDD